MKEIVSTDDLFKNIIGQETATFLLNSALRKETFAPAYLFAGPEGIGRKLVALRFLEGILTGGKISFKERRRLENANHPDLFLIEPTYTLQGELIDKSKAISENIHNKTRPQIRLEQIRNLSKCLSQNPIEAERTMVVIEEVEEMAEAASNALLKTLEEPGKALIILITTRPEKLLTTIRSRCQRIPFSRLNKNAIESILKQNSLDVNNNLDPINASYLDEIFRLADGSPGAFLNHLKIWQSIPKEMWSRLKSLPKEAIETLTLAKEINDLLDIEQQLWLINWLQQNLWENQKNIESIKILEKIRVHLKAYVQPRLAWEVGLLEMTQLTAQLQLKH